MSKNFWHDIESGTDVPEIINAIVEIPKGSMNKYEYDKKHNMIKLDRVLFSPFHYPGDYGLIPQTLSEDGDPLDALVLVTNPTYPGILIEARPIGLLQMKDDGEMDDKIICVATNDPRYLHTADITDLEDHYRSVIAHFFQVYKELEGKKVEILGWKSAKEAKVVIIDSIKRYKDTLKKYKLSEPPKHYFINSFETLGWSDPYPNDYKYVDGSLKDIELVRMPTKKDHCVYPCDRYVKG